MFMGEHRHCLDDKGRVIIPAKFREKLDGRFILTRGLDVCLFAFTTDEWAVQEEKLSTLPMTMADGRAFSRLFFSGRKRVRIGQARQGADSGPFAGILEDRAGHCDNRGVFSIRDMGGRSLGGVPLSHVCSL